MAVQKRNDELVDILSADFVRKRYPVAIAGEGGGALDVHLDIEDGTTITVVDGTLFGEPDLLRYDADVIADSADSRSAWGMLAQGESINLFDVSGETVQLRLTSSGNVELQRTAGANVYGVVLRLRWIIDSFGGDAFTHNLLIDWHPHRTSVETSTTRMILSGFQLLIHGAYTINGALDVQGDLVIL